jgi:hypothetical protein
MKARQIIEAATFGPEQLRVVFQAFDEAWATIASHFGNDSAATETVRTRLANCVLAATRDGHADAATIRNAALQALALEYKDVAGPASLTD